MPINPIVLQRRHAELGRIRLGQKVATQKGGTRPDKLDRFRFTSPNERHIRDLAQQYGGEPRPWDNAGKAEWEVISEAKAIPVIVVKGGMSQWMETWSGGGCVHRCDGVENVLTGEPCDPDDPKHQAAKATTRLSVMLPELGAIGVWRLETHGWNAAAELPGVVDLAMHVGDLVRAHLVLHERVAIKDGKTSRFVVPGLDLDVTPAQLQAIVSGGQGPTAIGSASGPVAIGSAPAPVTDWMAELAEASSVDQCQHVWHAAGQAGQLTDDLKAAITARARELTPPADDSSSPPPAQDDDPRDVDAAWAAVVTEAGRQNLTDADLRGAFLGAFGHPVGEATVAELETFLGELKATAA